MEKRLIKWHVGILEKLTLTLHNSDCKEWISEWYQGTENGTSENNVTIKLINDGSLCFFDEDDSDSRGVYFNKEQVEHLKKILLGNDGMFKEAIHFLEKFNRMFSPGNNVPMLVNDFVQVDSILLKAKERISFE